MIGPMIFSWSEYKGAVNVLVHSLKIGDYVKRTLIFSYTNGKRILGHGVCKMKISTVCWHWGTCPFSLAKGGGCHSISWAESWNEQNERLGKVQCDFYKITQTQEEHYKYTKSLCRSERVLMQTLVKFCFFQILF